MPIRKPTLADRLLHQPGRSPWATVSQQARCRDQLQRAKKFVLDEAAAAWLAQSIRECPRLIADAQDFAIPPFETMWIEMPRAVFAPQEVQSMEGVSELRMGFLIEGSAVRPAASGLAGGERPAGVEFAPHEFVLDRPLDDVETTRLYREFGIHPFDFDMFCWGYTAFTTLIADDPFLRETVCGDVANDIEDNPVLDERLRQRWASSGMSAMRERHGLRLNVDESVDIEPRRIWPRIRHTFDGGLSALLATLIFLNRTADLQTVQEVGFGRAMIDRKPRPLAAHRVVSLRLNPMPRLRSLSLSAGPGASRRLHDVRGHWCHDQLARAGCVHGIERLLDFGEFWVEEAPLRWKCSACGGRRWWRHEHSRGSAEKGVVAQSYRVTC